MYTLHFRLLVLREVLMSHVKKVLEFRSQIDLPHFYTCTTCVSSLRSTSKYSFSKKVTRTEIRPPSPCSSRASPSSCCRPSPCLRSCARSPPPPRRFSPAPRLYCLFCSTARRVVKKGRPAVRTASEGPQRALPCSPRARTVGCGPLGGAWLYSWTKGPSIFKAPEGVVTLQL